MASETSSSSSPARPLLRRVLSFREPLMLIPCILTFLATAASEFFHIYSSFLHSFARSLIPIPPPATAKLAAFTPYSAAAVDEDDEEVSPHLSREEVEEIMERMGLGLSGNGEGIKARIGHDEVSRMFDADEPSFAEVRRAFAVFDADGDGLIGAADLRAALARLGFLVDAVDAAACRDMIAASCGSVDGTMNLCQFIKFLEKGLC
uniref:EF-hand domain-containing protein n=1 Tax=Leersia perrieri TaxID=77586 RepID=A0A0D9X1U5_9ORYZ